jgi:dTDP-4-amino-4,6-dideoxygalactose transaminase
MKIVQAPRASAILFSVLAHRADVRPWLLPANICPIVPITFQKARVPFELVDISPATLALDLDRAEVLVRTRRYGGLLYAHTYGDPSTPREFFAMLRSTAPDLTLVDDRCLCIPDFAPDSSSPLDVILYSTGYAKIVDMNTGGYAFMADGLEYRPACLPFNPSHLAALVESYKQAARERIRFNYDDSDWLATCGTVLPWDDYRQQLEARLTASLPHRRALNQIYAAHLPRDWQLPDRFQTWRFTIRVANKQRVLDAILSAGLFASSHFASLAGIMSEGRAPHCEDLADEVINLFNDHYLTTEQAERVCSIILKAHA